VVFSFLLAWGDLGLIPAVRSFALRVGWADLPNERRLNREPLPNAGAWLLRWGIRRTGTGDPLKAIVIEGVLAGW